MNKEQILAKYGNEKIKFYRYYKYTFNFVGVAFDGTEIHAAVGGSSDDIYRLKVQVGKTETLKSICPDLCVLIKDGKEIGSYDEMY